MADARGYDDLIMDHIRNARGYGAPGSSTHQANGINPLCGDEMTVYATLDGERIEAVAYQSSCCGISMASASSARGTVVVPDHDMMPLFHRCRAASRCAGSAMR